MMENVMLLSIFSIINMMVAIVVLPHAPIQIFAG